MYKNKSVTVVFSTYNEKDSVKTFIESCFETGVIDNVIAINNNASEGTYEEIAKTKALQFIETRQGYGFGYQRGIEEALKINSDLIILVEPDGTFSANDVFKFLVYSDEFSVVFGTRTTSACIGNGANMGLFLKWGNWAVAKMVEVLFNTTHLSDVGCTYKLFHASTLRKIAPHFTVGKSHFGPELMLLSISGGFPFVEIPVHYLERVGESSVTGDFKKTFKLGFIMIGFILHFKFFRKK